MEHNPKGVNALAPENVFIIAVGPVTGTRMWSQSRFAVYSKSPATSGYGESYCGGSLAPRIKGCGVDAILIRGRLDSLQFLSIDENGVRFEDAAAIKGADCYKSEDFMIAHSPQGAKAMVIGPAGENLVKFACIKSDRWRSLGRGGMGAVLGSKNVKGITFSGSKPCEIFDQDMLTAVIKKVAEIGKQSPVTKLYQDLGTPMQVKVTNTFECFPTRYWTKGVFEKWQNISADYMRENFEVKRAGCPNCFLKCTKLSRLKHGRHAGLELEGPEYETIYALGGLNEIDSLEEIAYLNDLCDRLGMDTMSAGNISAFAIEARKAGKIDFDIDYNNVDRIAELFRLVANREGVGTIFAGGIQDAASKLGLEDIAIHVKGLEPAGFDPRVLKGMGLSYATSARGACHLRGTFYKAELSGMIKKEQIEGKARLMIDFEDRAAISDSLILCRFFRDFIQWELLADLIEATTGMRFSKPELEDLANNITNMTRAYNLREGLDASTDRLPKRFFREATAEGATLTEPEFHVMLDEYNRIRSRQ
jgi:aldehyde:ferredoxin oxidoreductase